MTKTNKDLKKQLIAAIAMVVVAALALGSATFAWFAMNTTVTAKDMKVTAKSEGGLAIAAYTIGDQGAAVAPASTAFASSASAKYKNDGVLAPASFSGTNWYKAEASDANNYAAKAGTYAAIAAGDIDKHRLISKFQVKSLDANTAKTPISLYVSSITVTGSSSTTSQDLDKSLRVLIEIGGKYYFFAPMYTSVTGDTLYFYNGTTRTAKTVGSDIYINDTTLSNGVEVMKGTLSTTAVDVNIYVFYEGEDDNCKSVNAVNISNLNVSVNFTTQHTN